MIVNIYSVKDELEGRYKSPFYAENDELAIRQFRSYMNNVQLWKDNPSDFTFWRLGTFEEETGEYISKKEMITNGRSVI